MRPLEYLTGCGERGKRWKLVSIIPLYVPEARPGRQGLEIIEERDEQQRGRGRTMKRGKKGMNNKEGKEEQRKRWKEAMNT